MRNTAAMGRFFGWLGVAIGAVFLAIGVFTSPAENARLESERCQIERQIGRRAAPCPPLEAPERFVLFAAGGSAFASGLFFLLLAGILATLLDMKDSQDEAARRDAERARAGALPAGAPPTRPITTGKIGDPPAIPMPSRFEMITRHGEPLGGAAWDLMRTAQKAGIVMPEAEALRKARGS